MSASAPSFRRLCATLTVAGLPAVVAPGLVHDASDLAVRSTLSSGEMFLAWGATPLVALSAMLLVLAPGLYAAIALGRARSFEQWVLDGFLLSLVGVSVLSGLAQAVLGDALRGVTYGAFLLGLAAVTCWWASARVHRDGALPAWTMAARPGGWLLAATWLAIVCLVPKLLWESFNGDGAHAFESSRRLLHHAMPFWPPDAGPVAGFPGMTSMLYAFPNAWFLRLFGEVEVAARLPFLLYLVVLWAAVRRLGSVLLPQALPTRTSEAGLALSIVAYLLAMAFSASYSPYSADLALPATQDTLLMIVFLAALVAAAERETVWLVACAFLTYVSLPSGLLLLAFWLGARFLVERPIPWRELVRGGGSLVAAVVLAAVVGRVAVALGSAPPGGEYGIVGILKYFAFVQFTDWTRLSYAAIPAGLFPVGVLVFFRRQDALARTLAVVTAAYFGFFYFQAHISLHHFVPAMVLPMAVAWRMVHTPSGVSLGRAWAPLGFVAVLLAFPWGRTAIHRDGREVGSAVLVRIEGYASTEAAPMRASTTLDRLFPYDWVATVPATYGGSPLVWNHYARHGGDPEANTNYIVQSRDMPLPAGFMVAGADSTGAVVLVRDEGTLARDRARRPATPAGSRVLDVPRGVLFHGVPLPDGPRLFDTAQLLKDWGLDPDPILRRLGVRRPGGGSA